MAHGVLHMVCLGTHPCGSYRIIVPVYKTKSRIHPMKLKMTICDLVFWVFEALPLPSTNRSTLEFVLYFPEIKERIFCPYFMGVWGPSSSPLPIIINSSLFLISLRRLKEEFLSSFFEYDRSPPPLYEK